jgi:hypothetical protein
MSLRIDTSEWISGALVIGGTGLGVLAESIPSTGAHGPAYTYNDLSLPADNGKEICGRITVWPAYGTLTPAEDTSFSFAGPDGSHAFTYQLYVDGVATGAPVVSSIVIGAAGHTLAAANSGQSATSSAGAISTGTGTGHILSAAACGQSATSSAGAISTGPRHILSAAACGQSATSSADAVAQTRALIAAPSVQDAVAAASPIVQTHLLAAASSNQGAVSALRAQGGTGRSNKFATAPVQNYSAISPAN